MPAVTAPPGSRLEGLLASYEAVKAAAEEAAERFESLKAAVKAEMAAACPGEQLVTASGAGLPRLQLAWKKAWRLDTARLKSEQPETYARYAEQKGRWELRAL